jgi:hypothetical protein
LIAVAAVRPALAMSVSLMDGSRKICGKNKRLRV